MKTDNKPRYTITEQSSTGYWAVLDTVNGQFAPFTSRDGAEVGLADMLNGGEGYMWVSLERFNPFQK